MNIREEVQKLFANRSTINNKQETVTTVMLNIASDQEIEQVCEWLKTYQCCSYVNIIIDCVQKFNVISNDDNDESLDYLQQLALNTNCSLKEISQTNIDLYQRFQKLTSQHLQLIKTFGECSNVVQMMKQSDLYSIHGLRRFQELRDNLTTQFQLQERNSMILNSWIITYALCKPFVFQVNTLEEFVDKLAQLANIDESSLEHIKVVNDNIQIVNMWLSAEETTMLDNALITMEHIYKTGFVNIHLRRLMNAQSYFEIEYSIDKVSAPIKETNDSDSDEQFEYEADDEVQQREKIKFTLSMADIDDHKRQLTFCNVDVQQNMIYKKVLLNEQLLLLKLIEKIYLILVKLETAGHPNFQLRKDNYEIHDRFGDINKILSEVRNNQDNNEQQLELSIKNRTKYFELIYRNLETDYDMWIKYLEKYRQESRLLKLFSNHQIMIMIILLTTSTTQNEIQRKFLEKIFLKDNLDNQKDEQFKLTIRFLSHYLQSLRINECNLSENNIIHLYNKYKIEYGTPTDTSLKQLCQFLKELFNNGKELSIKNTTINENQQFLVTLNSIERTSDKGKFQNDFDMDTFCILLNIFVDRLPADYQILWCSSSTEDDIRLFFSRVRTFRYLTFAVMDMDKMHHRLREFLLNEQDSLAKQTEPHAPIYYFSRELTSCRKGLRPFIITPKYRNPSQTYSQLMTLFRRNNFPQPQIQMIYGTAGIGKTHRIRTNYKDSDTSCVSINDKLNLSSLISSFLSFESKTLNIQPSIYFNISIHAPFEQLNRTLFSLFVCGSLNDISSGLTFSSSITRPWKFIIEIPYTNKCNLTIQDNFKQILPLLSIISPTTLEEVTDTNYQLFIGEEEELVARFLKAYENQTIDRRLTISRHGVEKPVAFNPLTDHNECRQYIYNCIERYAPEMPRNKIFELSFTKFLYRRIRFFTGFYYCYNMTIEQLGSIAMAQMIDEAKYLTQINFSTNNYPRVYLVYDPEFSLHLLHNNWNNVPHTLKILFDDCDRSRKPEYQDNDYFIKCLSWLIDISYDTFKRIMKTTKFILTENFVYKLFHIHERKLTKLGLIIEGETGVGKTFLLTFYSLLLNANITDGKLDNNIIPRILERTSLWLLTDIISGILEEEPRLLSLFLLQIESKLNEEETQTDEESVLNTNLPHFIKQEDDIDEDLFQIQDEPVNHELLKKMKLSLQNFEYNDTILRNIWKTIINISNDYARNITKKLINALHNFVTLQLIDSPLTDISLRLKNLLEDSHVPTVEKSIEIFNEFVVNTRIKPLFYRLLLHPGITEEQIEEFMSPISQLAQQLPKFELVVFFDEVNTSSCLGLFKEMFMDGTLHGLTLPKNIFFTAAINPLIISRDNSQDDLQVHRRDYLVHELPQSLESLKVFYGVLDTNTLEDYIKQKIATFTIVSADDSKIQMPLEAYAREILAQSILNAQQFCEKHLGRNSVSQREIQRCFNLIDFFWKMKYDEDDGMPNPIRCIALSIALIYYFRLPTKEDNLQRKDSTTPSREELGELLLRTIPDFVDVIQNELEKFVNTDNFVVPHGVAVNQAIREHIFSIVVSIVTRTPLCIIGAPGQSKTLSFQIVLQNLQGSQLSTKSFCKRLPAIDPFFCLGSKYSRSEDIAYIFDRAIKREQQYQQNRIDTRCVVFLDEASLPDEKKMVLKVLHPYLDECKVAFVAVANKSFDAANANRMICIYRSLPSKDDQKILAYGCLGLQINHHQQLTNKNYFDDIIFGLCQGYRQLLTNLNIPHIFHDRDFIYMLRELRFELLTTTEDQEISINTIKPISLLRALEDNFNGIKPNEFEELVRIFFNAIKEKSPYFCLPSNWQKTSRDIPTILRESMKLDSTRRRLYGRYKLIIDESEDESAVNLLLQTGIIDSDLNRTTIFRMSDFSDDINNELRNVEILSTIKLCMETGKTILMVNTGRIHGSLYDVFNQNFSIMATGDTRKIFSKVAIGPKTIDVVVHEDFQCIVHIKRSEFKDIPAPFLSRFQKYSLSINDFYRIRLQKLPLNEQSILKNVEEKSQSLIQHFGREYFYGLNESTLYSCLLSLIQINDNGDHSLLNVHQHYTQLTIKLKSFIEQNSMDTQQCLLRLVLSKLIQLVSPESIILKLPAFEEKVEQWLCNLYFHQQEHFNIESFISQLILNPSIDVDNNELLPSNNINITTKVIIFTRTSSYVVGLNQQSKNELFNNDNNTSETIEILNLGVIENSVELQEKFHNYENDRTKNVLIIVIDARIGQQRLHIPFVRQLIDKTEYSCNANNRMKPKYFLMLLHSPSQDLYHQSCFPSIFLKDWDYYFFDTCAPGSAFHLQKMLRILSSSYDQQQPTTDNILCDLNILFEDCLWDFCSRIQIILPELPQDMFTNQMAYEFYNRQTNTMRRVKCLKQILQQSIELQKRIVNIYHEHLLTKKNSSKKIYNLIYQISKDILCGKRFDGLIGSIQSQTRISFTNFVSNIFKFIVNDYGLETLPNLSADQNNSTSLMNLIDYQSFAVNDDKDILSSSTTQGIFQLVTHYSCIPQTPLYHLFHQRIKSHADEIKLTLILKQTENKETEDGLRPDYYAIPPITITDENETTQYTFEQFRSKLINSMLNDKILTDIICERILYSYSNDLVRTFCTIIENNFTNDIIQCQQTVEFVSRRWLLLIDDNDRQLLDAYPNKNLWLLAHVYTSIEYDQNDLISIYSACRIMDRLDPTRSFYENLFNDDDVTRSNVRETFFRLIFDYLWKNLCQLCSNHENSEAWIYTYTFISKYYPSENVLQSMQLIDIKNQIEFMNLAYLILMNEKTPEPHELVSNLLRETNFNQTSICLRLFPKLIDIIYRYLENKNVENSTLMIDLQQWIISILKSMTQLSKQDIYFLFKYLDQPTCKLSLSMKQFLFDELVNITLKLKQQTKQTFDVWDRLDLLPILIECLTNVTLLQNYQIPYHPSIFSLGNNRPTIRQTLLDLYFFHLRRQMNNETITSKLINKGMLLEIPRIENRLFLPLVENIFKQLKDYFRLRMIALLLCQTDLQSEEQNTINPILSTTINELLSIDQQPMQFSNHLQLFLSTIISKQSWNFLLNLLKSDYIQHLNKLWATTLYDLLELNQTFQQNKSLQLCHRIQFTLSINNNSSIFPKLHQPYEELREIVNICVRDNTKPNQWKSLSDWIQLKLISNPIQLKLDEIKSMLLLNIYYDYYCNNKLTLISSLLEIIQNDLQLSSEEFRVFCILIQPERYMIGYSLENDNNSINNLFKLDCQNEFDLGLRHMLVNLMAMILLGGKQSFLWTFTFQSLALENTFGFGSTSINIIQGNGVHYDCGCIISQNGDLIRYANRGNESALNVPAVYVVYFSTFGALAWHLLLFETSVENLHGPILTPAAIADTTPTYRLSGDSIRAKVCNFVCTRLLSTFHWLSVRSNPDDACILLNHCFEQMAFLTQNTNSWIKPVYTTLHDQVKAEEKYQNEVFYFVYEKLAEYKTYINQLNLKSQIQTNLQSFIDQMPLIIQFTHFKTELHRQIHSKSSLKILRHILDSMEFLKKTKLIYDLSQFYLLLHQTYTQLIDQNEFLTITLQQLYDRGEKHYNHSQYQQNQNESKNHRLIIQNGIDAVNMYHQFADGLIRPGACDETQRFTTITFDTPVNYLVTNENYDEGDIIRRILSVLVDYHNNLLDLLEKELNNNQNHTVGVLKNLINELTSKEVSISQVAKDSTGVITLNDENCLWIEQLSRASLINNEEQDFLTVDSRLKFDFVYVQSQIIRTFLLLCRINYQHIIQKYQCHTKRNQATTTTNDIESLNLDEKYLLPLSNEQLDSEWNYLKDMLLDKLYHAYNLLRQIALTLKNHRDDKSSLTLYQFAETMDHDNDIHQRLEQYEIKDFQLCHIDHILKLYAESISGFQHLFTDIHPLLRIPIDTQLNKELIRNFDANIINNDLDKIQLTIQTITEFLNELKTIENTLLQRSTQSLTETCQHLAIENSILSSIPERIKCENYVEISIHLIRTRSILQERKMNIEVKEMKLWNENFNSFEQQEKQENRFQQYLQSEDESEQQNTDELSDWIIPSMEMDDIIINNLPDIKNKQQFEGYSDEHIELNLKLVSSTSSAFIQQIHKYREEHKLPLTITTKPIQKFTIINPDGKSITYMWRREKFCEQLRKLFDDKKYDLDTLVVIDKNEIFVDFINNDYHPPYQPLTEYRIIEKQLLVEIQFQFQTTVFKYQSILSSHVSALINRLIDNDRLSSESCLCFFDEYGKCIDDGIVGDLCKTNNKTITIFVTEETFDTNNLCELILRYKEGRIQTSLFHPTTKWQQIDLWLKTLSQINEPPIDDLAFVMRKQKVIIDNSQTISSIIDQTEPMIVDAINRNITTEVIFSYETNTQLIHTLKSMKISTLLKDENLLRQLNLIDSFLDDCILLLGETSDEILITDDVGHYSILENQPVHFRITVAIQILKYDDKEQIKIPLSNRNTTIKQLLELTGKSIDIYKYLASNETQRVIDANVILSNINQTRFILLKENETCLVWINKSNESLLEKENEKYQRYFIHATIDDICKEYQIDVLHQYLVYSNDFVPSVDTQLISFQSESPARFIVTDDNLPVTVTVQKSGNNQSIYFNCSMVITIKRLHSISCQLFGLSENCYQLTLDDGTLIEDDISLEDMDETITDIQFQLISTMPMNCSILYSEQTITLPCYQDTLASTIVKETLEKLHIQYDNIDKYELVALTTDRPQIDFDLSINDIHQLFPSMSMIIPLELRKKDE
ncbi:unnamed protein product [Adineta steineri]|uniref:Uncharacterized protein n=1 Tax=Adineta steineri TaxID=433720 RepID=A0A814XYG5_9BILA|nr:unnamed protein product [Adineta steineri]